MAEFNWYVLRFLEEINDRLKRGTLEICECGEYIFTCNRCRPETTGRRNCIGKGYVHLFPKKSDGSFDMGLLQSNYHPHSCYTDKNIPEDMGLNWKVATPRRK